MAACSKGHENPEVLGNVTIEARVTAYGRAAVEMLAAQADELKGGDRLAPVTVVVASNYVAVAARRALAARPGGIANVTFVTLHRLAERLGAAKLAGAGRRPVSAPVIAAAMRAVLDEAPGVFAPVADHPATEQALVTAHRELRAVPDAALDAVAECSARASDVVRIHRAVRKRLVGAWHDEEDLLVAAAGALRSGASPEIGPVVVHLLRDLTTGEADLVQALATRGRLLVNVGVTGDADADGRVLEAHARAGIAVSGVHPIEPACAARIVSASDPDGRKSWPQSLMQCASSMTRRPALRLSGPSSRSLKSALLNRSGDTSRRSTAPRRRSCSIRSQSSVLLLLIVTALRCSRDAASIWSRMSANSGDTMMVAPAPLSRSKRVATK